MDFELRRIKTFWDKIRLRYIYNDNTKHLETILGETSHSQPTCFLVKRADPLEWEIPKRQMYFLPTYFFLRNEGLVFTKNSSHDRHHYIISVLNFTIGYQQAVSLLVTVQQFTQDGWMVTIRRCLMQLSIAQFILLVSKDARHTERKSMFWIVYLTTFTISRVRLIVGNVSVLPLNPYKQTAAEVTWPASRRFSLSRGSPCPQAGWRQRA